MVIHSKIQLDILVYILPELVNLPPDQQLACPTFFISRGSIKPTYIDDKAKIIIVTIAGLVKNFVLINLFIKC